MKNIDNTPNCIGGKKHELTPVRFRGAKRRLKCDTCNLMTGWRKQAEVKPKVKEQKSTLQELVDDYDDKMARGKKPSEAELRKASLHQLTVAQLKDEARDLSITGFSKMKKDELINAIAEQGELIGV